MTISWFGDCYLWHFLQLKQLDSCESIPFFFLGSCFSRVITGQADCLTSLYIKPSEVDAWHKKQRKLLWSCAWHRVSRFELPHEKTTGEMKSIHGIVKAWLTCGGKKRETKIILVLCLTSLIVLRVLPREKTSYISQALKLRQRTKETSMF